MQPSIFRKDWQDRGAIDLSLYQPQQPAPQKTSGRGGTPTSLISEGGALGGAAIGAGIGSIVPVVGTAIGGIIGAGLGAFGGRIAENKVRDDRWGLGDAAKEGALSTVLAGPLKLGKYGFTAAKGLKAGAGLEKALVSAAEGATKSSIKSAAGKSLSGAADNLAVKQFRFTPSQLTNFKTKFGEDAGQVVRKYGFTSADDITKKGIDPLQQQFDNLVSGIGGVPKNKLKKNLYADISKLTKSASTDNMALGKSLKAEADQLLKRYGDSVDAKDLNVIRREFDSLVNYTQKTANPARYGVNKRIADALRKTLQESDQSGSLKNVGRELQKLRQLSDNALKQAELGRGSLPFGLNNLLGGAVGGVGGPAGAVGGIVATQALNSPAGRKAMMKGAEKAGSKLSGQTVNGMRSAVTGAAIGQVGEGIINNASQPYTQYDLPIDQSLSNMTDSMYANPTSDAPMINAQNMNSPYTNMDGLSSGYPQTQNPYPVENFMYDVQRDPQNADEYYKLYQMYQEVLAQPEQDAAPKLSAAQATRAAAAQNALNDIPMIMDAIETGKLGGVKALPGSGTQIGRRILGTENLDAALYNIADNILRARSGAATPEAEVKRFVEGFLPSATDSKQAKIDKLNRAVRELQSYVNPVAAAGGTLEDALMQAQGAY